MDKIEALKDLLTEDRKEKLTKAGEARMKRVAKTLGMSYDDIAYEVLGYYRPEVAK